MNEPNIPLLDCQELATLVGLIGPDGLAELVDIFAGSSLPRLAAIESAVRQGDSESVSSAAHSYKGAAEGVCALRVAALARRMEGDARAGCVDGAGYLLRCLRFETQRALTELRAFVAA